MVYYRKYRPQTIAELDLDQVRERLTTILKSKNLPHAFLFTGPKGLGKTSSARILAKAINCEVVQKSKDGKDIEPCNKCEVCVSITSGSNIDVLEIDAASNRGIDEIRDLREKIKFSPSALSKKIYIIDEVHMLTTDAFNALLKTLEEPPSHAVFILCTTEEDKIPQTIVSRTFQVHFNKPTKDELMRSLKRIVDGEKLDIENGVLDEVYKMSEGSFRDAAKILEELSFENGKISKEVLERTYKTQSTDVRLLKLIASLEKKDVQESLLVIDELAQSGADFKIVTQKLTSILHDMLLSENKGSLSKKETSQLISLVNESYKDIKFSVLQQIPLELVVIEWCLEREPKAVIQKNQDIVEKKEEELVVEVSKDYEKKVEEPAPQGEKNEEEESNLHKDMFHPNILPDNFFSALLSRLKSDNHSIVGILRGCKLQEMTDDKVIFTTPYKFHKDKLSEAKIRSIIDKRSSELLRRDVVVEVVIVEKSKQ